MNTTIIKGNMKAGAGQAIMKWASLTGNKKLYVEGLAEQLIGKAQRSYGRLTESSGDMAKMVRKQLGKMDTKDISLMLKKGAKKMPFAVLLGVAVTWMIFR